MPVVRKPVDPGYFNFDELGLARIRAAYGLETADAFMPFLVDGDTCTLLEVRSETSRKAVIEDRGRRYFLKQVPWYADRLDLLTTSHKLQRALQETGAPVAGIVRRLEGGTWLEIDGLRFVLFEHCDGYRFQGLDIQRRHAGAALCLVHQCAVHLPESLKEDWFGLVRDHLQLAEELRGGDGDVDALLRLMSDRLDAVAEKAGGAGWDTLAAVPVHGDFNPWNVLFHRDGRTRAIIDFDNCDVGPRVRDIAEGVLTFCGMRYAADSTTFDQPFSAEVDPAATRAFLDGYRQATTEPLDGAEWRCVDLAIQVAFVELAALGVIRGELKAQRDGGYVAGWLARPPAPSAMAGR